MACHCGWAASAARCSAMLSMLFALLSVANGCPEVWDYGLDAPAVVDTEACVRSQVESVYGRDLDPGTIGLDVPAGAGGLLKLSRTQVEHALDAVRAVCSECSTDACDFRDIYCLRFAAARRLFERELAARATPIDSNAGVDISPLIATIAKGEGLDNRQLKVDAGKSRLSPLSLWRLRNAVFARHGRKFENSDLATFFYGKGGCCKEQSDYSPDKLSQIDRANVKLIASLERPPATAPSAPKVVSNNMIAIPRTSFLRACASRGYDGPCSEAQPDQHHAIPTTVEAFLIDKYEVTTGEYRRCIKRRSASRPASPSARNPA